MKERLDVLLVKRGLVSSREKAKTAIQSGGVYVDGKQERKAGTMVREEQTIEVKAKPLAYVSRGGLKLEKAMECFQIDLSGLTCMDVGASTGGFTDCMLQKGACRVYSVDVGYGQLDERLREDERVRNMERTNVRELTREDVGEEMDFISIDVSFISLTKVLEPVRELLKEEGRVCCLVKPQFEAGKGKVGKRGVVRDPAIHVRVLEDVIQQALSLGFQVMGLDFSPVKGPEGNIEYLLYLRKSREGASVLLDVKTTVKGAWERLK